MTLEVLTTIFFIFMILGDKNTKPLRAIGPYVVCGAWYVVCRYALG